MVVEQQVPLPISMLKMNLLFRSWTTRLLLLVVEADSAVVAVALVALPILLEEQPEEEGAVQLGEEACPKGIWQAADEVGEIGKRFDFEILSFLKFTQSTY